MEQSKEETKEILLDILKQAKELLMSKQVAERENDTLETKKKKSHAKRLAMARIMKKQQEEAIRNKTLSEELYEHAGIFHPEIDQNGFVVIPVKWKTTKNRPDSIYGNELFLQKNTPFFKGKSIEEIKAFLLMAQAYNDKKIKELKTTFSNQLSTQMTEEEKQELKKLEEEFPFEVEVEKEAFENPRIKPR